MKDKEVINLLEHYRHDFMNDLQIVHGYLSMQDTTKAQAKINKIIYSSQLKRKLRDTNATSFILWVLKFNILYTNLRLTYNINIHRPLHAIDQKLVAGCQHIIDSMIKLGSKNEFYQVHIDLEEVSNSLVELTMTIQGKLTNQNMIKEHIENISNDQFLIDVKMGKELKCVLSFCS